MSTSLEVLLRLFVGALLLVVSGEVDKRSHRTSHEATSKTTHSRNRLDRAVYHRSLGGRLLFIAGLGAISSAGFLLYADLLFHMIFTLCLLFVSLLWARVMSADVEKIVENYGLPIGFFFHCGVAALLVGMWHLIL